MVGKTCCFTGHRAAKLPWRYYERDPRCLDLKARLYDAVDAVYSDGVDHFICGMADGCDLYFCEAVLRLKADHPEVFLEAAVPFPGQADNWSNVEKDRYDSFLGACDKITLLQEEYTPGCMMKRNRYMVDHADLIIACYDGKPGGTLNTLRYAIEKGIQIVQLPIE